MDTIFIQDLAVVMNLGVPEWERRAKQTVLINCEIKADIKKAAASRKIEDALNYYELTKALEEKAQSESYVLVETLIEDLAELIESNYKPAWFSLSISKPNAIANVKGVGIRIERGEK